MSRLGPTLVAVGVSAGAPTPSVEHELLMNQQEEAFIMLHWSLVFLVIALIAALLGFGGIAGAAAGIAKMLFFIFLVIWLVALMFGRRSI